MADMFILHLGGSEMNRTASLCAIAVAFAACSPAGAQPGTRKAGATPQRSAIKVVRNDRLVLGPETRICVETTLDPEAKRIVEASGQVLYSRLQGNHLFNHGSPGAGISGSRVVP
jgi:hypothetical protein